MIREVLRMGDPRLWQKSAAQSKQFDTPELRELLHGHAGHDGASERRRPRRAADRRAAARGDLRRDIATRAIPDAEDGARHGADQPRARRRSADEIEEGWEGCLSVPGMRGWVPRYHEAALLAASTSRATASTARWKASTPASCSTNRPPRRRPLPDAHPRLPRFGFNEALFPGQALPAEESEAGVWITGRMANCSRQD